MIASSTSDKLGSRWKPWHRWLILLLFAVLEGSLAGATQDGLAGAVKGGLFAALTGPLLLAAASKVGHNRRRYLGALLFAAVAEAAAVLLLVAMARFVAGLPAWLLAAQLVLLVTLVGSFGAAITREKHWTIRGSVIGAVLGAASGAALGIYIGIAEREPPLLIAIIAGACGFMFAIIGALIGALVFASIPAIWRSFSS